MDNKKIESLVYELIHEKEKELANCMAQEWIYMREWADPKNITKAQAESNLAVYQKRIKACEQHIELYKQYIKEKLQ